jgi:hypothetical protein
LGFFFFPVFFDLSINKKGDFRTGSCADPVQSKVSGSPGLMKPFQINGKAEQRPLGSVVFQPLGRPPPESHDMFDPREHGFHDDFPPLEQSLTLRP